MTNQFSKIDTQTFTNELAKNPFQITTFAEAERYAKMIAESDFAPKDYKGKPGNVMIAMQMGFELGIPASQAIQNIAVINGRPSLYGDLALALVRRNKECKGVNEWMDGSIKNGNAVCYCEVKRNNEVITGEFSVRQAQQAGLLSKPGPWTQYPERMLKLRARGFALRDSFPDVLKGVYIEGELIEDEILEEHLVEVLKPEPKLGLDAVKNSIAKNASTMTDQIDVSELNVNIETGEVTSIEPSQMPLTLGEVLRMLETAKTVEDLISAKDIARQLHLNEAEKNIINDAYKKKQAEIK